MSGNGTYICPFCEKGQMTIYTERTGPKGFRTTDWFVTNQTCDCEIYESDNTLMAIESFKDYDQIKNDICECCKENQSTIHNPIKAWLGEYEDICTECFKIKMQTRINDN